MKFFDIELHAYRHPNLSEFLRREFVTRIESLGGTVTYSYLMPSGNTWLFCVHMDERHYDTVARWALVWRISESPKQDYVR